MGYSAASLRPSGARIRRSPQGRSPGSAGVPRGRLGIPTEAIPGRRARQWCYRPHRGKETLMSTSQPVIVLVHGAWADASSWNSVIPELQRPRLHRVRAAQPAARPAAGLRLRAPVPDPERGPPRAAGRSGRRTPTAGRSSPTPRSVPPGSGPWCTWTPSSPIRAIPSAAWPARSPDPAWTTRPSTRCPTPAHRPVTSTSTSSRNLVPGCFATGLPASQAALIAATQRPLTASAFTGAVRAPGLEDHPVVGRDRDGRTRSSRPRS